MSQRGRKPTDPRMILALEREVEAVRLRKQGLSYDEIAARIGITQGTVFAAVHRALNKLAEECKETTEEIRAIELQRLDAMQAPLNDRATSGQDDDAVHAVLKIMEHRAKLCGLAVKPPEDKEKPLTPSGPVTFSLTGGDGVTHSEALAKLTLILQSAAQPGPLITNGPATNVSG
jgi:predicted DNA-binding protein (UPF0251 family)